MMTIAVDTFLEASRKAYQSIKPINRAIVPAINVNSFENDLSNLIDHFQMAKYPATNYECKKFDVPVVNDGKTETMHVTYIKAKNLNHVNSENLHTLKMNAYLVRALTLAETLDKYMQDNATQLNDFSSMGLSEVEQKTKNAEIQHKVRTSVRELIQAEIQNISTGKKINSVERTNLFLAKLGMILVNNSNLTRENAIESIKQYERYVVSEKNTNNVLINESQIGEFGKTKSNVIQIDIPLNAEFTKSQKQDYLRIHSNNPPVWFKELPKAEQDWFARHVPKTRDAHAEWIAFASINRTSAMQQTSGIKNARENNVYIESPSGKMEHVSQSNKIATPYVVEGPKSERQRLTDLNAEQLINHLSQNAESTFRSHWGLNANVTVPKLLILSQALLSPLLGKADSPMIEGQRSALKKINDDKNSLCQVAFVNNAVNIWRVFDKIKQNWKDIIPVMNYFQQLINHPAIKEALYSSSLSPAQRAANHEKVILMQAILNELKQLLNSKKVVLTGNKAANISALLGLLAETAGLPQVTNCKSGKDRTGLDEAHRLSHLIYYRRYHKLPSYFDTGKDRQNYIEIYNQVFNTLKVQESAQMNTPGSHGAKDSAKMLDFDIAQAIAEAYKESNSRANINKTQEKNAERKANIAATQNVPGSVEYALEKLQIRLEEIQSKKQDTNKYLKAAALEYLRNEIKLDPNNYKNILKDFIQEHQHSSMRLFKSKTMFGSDLTMQLIKDILKLADKLPPKNDQEFGHRPPATPVR